MKKTSTIAGIVVLIVIAIFVYTSLSKKKVSTPEIPNPTGSEVVCTQETKLCADGSYVGRSGPQCEFAKCPTVNNPKTTSPKTGGTTSYSEQKIFKTALGSSFYYDGLTITPFQVLEDSRCPVGENCLVAGKVSLNMKIETNTFPNSSKISQTSKISLTSPIIFQDKKISLLTMNPLPVAGKNITPSEYSFEFSVSKK